MSLNIINFGCRLNAQEAEVIRDQASQAGLDGLAGGAVVINSCAVTGEAVRQTRQAIRRAARQNPGARIVVTGCAAQIDPKSFASMDEVDLVLGNEEKLHSHNYRALPDFGVNSSEKARVADIFEVRANAPHLVGAAAARTRAFVQVQNGCDHRCTFCIIPFGRGNSRSVPMGAVVDQVKLLVDQNIKEVVLTGVDLTSYGPDLPGRPSLARLIEAILKQVPDLPRLRLSSIDSIEADEALIDLITSESRLMPHLHLSLQSGDNMILKRMKRRHSREDAIRFCQQVKQARPEVLLGADLIAGFPTESEAMFEQSLAIVDECNLTFLHVFPFSPREGTPAARMPQLPRDEINARATQLRQKGEQAIGHAMERASGHTHTVLVERNDGRGHTDNYLSARVQGAAPGSIVSVQLSLGADGTLCGEEFNQVCEAV